MEKELFQYDSLDFLDSLIIQFYDCTLNKDLCGFTKGTEFPLITMDYENSAVEFYQTEDDENPVKFKMSLIFGEKI